jgi:hypothetical protein
MLLRVEDSQLYCATKHQFIKQLEVVAGGWLWLLISHLRSYAARFRNRIFAQPLFTRTGPASSTR